MVSSAAPLLGSCCTGCYFAHVTSWLQCRCLVYIYMVLLTEKFFASACACAHTMSRALHLIIKQCRQHRQHIRAHVSTGLSVMHSFSSRSAIPCPSLPLRSGATRWFDTTGAGCNACQLHMCTVSTLPVAVDRNAYAAIDASMQQMHYP